MDEHMETGVVVEVRGSVAAVQMKRLSACSKCGGCKPWGEKEMLIEAENAVGAKLNDRVQLAVKPAGFLQALGILYGIPFAAIMLGFFIGAYIGGALAGLLAGTLMAWIAYKLIKASEPSREKKGHHVVVVAVVKS